VRRLLFASTIAVKYPGEGRYFYARSKERAENTVLRARLRATVLRPTIVLGPGSRIAARLRSLAKLPLLAIPGGGRARIQPIDVRDLATLIAVMVEEDRFNGEVVEAGGPDVLTLREFLTRLRSRAGGGGPVLSLPLAPLRTALGLLERVSPAAVPVTQGQLAAFAHDSTAEPHKFVERLHPRMRGASAMIDELAGA
jgi:NADH dehydrogenase